MINSIKRILKASLFASVFIPFSMAFGEGKIIPPILLLVLEDQAVTVPTTQVKIQSNYLLDVISIKSGYSAKSTNTETEYSDMVEIYGTNIEAYNKLGQVLAGGESEAPEPWNSNTTYAEAGNIVSYNDGAKYGEFINSWWTLDDTPSFIPDSGKPWKLLKRTDSGGTTLTVEETVDSWIEDAAYTGGSLVFSSNNDCYQAKYWTQGDDPDLVRTDYQYGWESPWEVSEECSSTELSGSGSEIIDPVGGGTPEIEQPPVIDTENDNSGDGTPTIPPVVPEPEVVTTPSDPVIPITSFPDGEYEFLREVTTTHWDWLFPLRSGKYVAATEGGATRNQPPIASENGSTDTFNLENFIKAVFAYNTWAEANGYKQFLNEGTKKQQAQEFIVFWAKSSRETSGSWSNAPEPWIVNDSNYGGDVWKGGLYWVEEVGYSTDDQGKSTAINYVDAGSAYAPVVDRSYYGRGVIQLSWNYNYGAFSAWLYDNGMLKETITERDILLTRPDYVATKGDLSIMSGIWFWMTPQGAKPSSHDVIYGDVYNVSQSSQDQGLPQRHDGVAIPAAAGDTTDESVMAYRLGTIINIVNGGLECNKAAAWHPGPMQRVSYFNAYTMYFNDMMAGLNATRVSEATNVWDDKIDPAVSSDDLMTASCYAQKSYYGW